MASPASGQQTAEYHVVPVTNGATLTGRVVFDGEVPRAHRSMITKDVDVCGLGYRERQDVDISRDRGLRDVVISIEGIERGKPWPESDGRPEVSQEGCTFLPHLQVVRKGQEIDIVNPDPVLHNIHAFELVGSGQRTLFNLGQPPEERVITHVLQPRRGHHIRLECDAHDFMLGWVYAADTPYASLVDEDGRFRIDRVPPGTYTVTAWHPDLGVRKAEVTLSPDGEGELVFRFSS